MAGIRLSYTANNKYQDSPRAWYLHYERKIREKQMGSALPFGSVIDDALNFMLNNKRSTEDAVPDPRGVFINKWKKFDINGKKEDLRTSENIKFYKSDLAIPTKLLNDEDKEMMNNGVFHQEWVTLRRKGLLMLDAYEVQVMPHLKEIIAVQEYVRLNHKDGNYIMGYVDLVARFFLDEEANKYTDEKGEIQHYHDPELAKFNDKIIIFDNKTSGTKYTPTSVAESPQLGTYTSCPNEDYDADAEGYIVLPKKFRSRKLPHIPIQIIIDQVADEVIVDQMKEYADTFHGIKMGNFPCTGGCKDNFWGCPYAKFCESDGENMEGLVDLGKEKK